MSLRIAELLITPIPLKAGSQTFVKCRVEGDEAIRRVYITLPDGTTRNFSKVNDVEFELSEQVPWDVPLYISSNDFCRSRIREIRNLFHFHNDFLANMDNIGG